MPSQPKHIFRLYIAGQSANSVMAVENLKALCREILPQCHEIEIVDVLRQPEAALRERILVTPTLLRLAPGQLVRIIGNLSEREAVLALLGLTGATP